MEQETKKLKKGRKKLKIDVIIRGIHSLLNTVQHSLLNTDKYEKPKRS